MSEQKIIEFLQQNGPSNPAQVGKFLGVQLLFASAMLSEAASKGHVKISKMKVGSSPLYYLESGRDKLAGFSEKLNPKDRQAFELLKTGIVLRDNEQTPIVRVSLRAIKDFAIPLNIVRNGVNETFWKWYMITDHEATEKIKDIFAKADGFDTPTKKAHQTEENIAQETKKEETKKIVPEEKKETKEEINKPEITQNIPVKEAPIKKEEKPIEKDSQTTLEDTKEEVLAKEKVEEKQQEIKEEDINKPEDEVKSENSIDQITKNNIPEVKLSSNSLNEDFSVNCTSPFGVKIYNYFKEKGFSVLNYELENKKTKFSFIIDVPNAVSSTKYYAKAIDKKTLNEGDLALVLVEGNYKKYPCILFTTGKTSKKIEEKLSNLFKDLTIISIQ